MCNLVGITNQIVIFICKIRTEKKIFVKKKYPLLEAFILQKLG